MVDPHHWVLPPHVCTYDAELHDATVSKPCDLACALLTIVAEVSDLRTTREYASRWSGFGLPRRSLTHTNLR